MKVIQRLKRGILEKKYLNNFLLISGSGRNIGKTTLACLLIEQLSNKHYVVGIKISPHTHDGDSDKEMFKDTGKAKIFVESNTKSNKDSSRMLRSGASKVFYIECNDDGLPEAIDSVTGSIEKHALVICESGALAQFFKPGYHILIVGDNIDESKPSYKINLELSNVAISSNTVFRSEAIKVFNKSGDWIFEY